MKEKYKDTLAGCHGLSSHWSNHQMECFPFALRSLLPTGTGNTFYPRARSPWSKMVYSITRLTALILVPRAGYGACLANRQDVHRSRGGTPINRRDRSDPAWSYPSRWVCYFWAVTRPKGDTR